MTREQFVRQAEGVQVALRRFLAALCCGDTQQADDIAQEALIKAYLNSDSLKDQGSFKAWVFKIAYTSFLSHKRSERHTMVSDDNLVAVAAEDRADAGFRYQALYAALDKLPPKERTSVVLYYMEGYSIKEVASITTSSEDAVKQHLSRGRVHLREILKNE